MKRIPLCLLLPLLVLSCTGQSLRSVGRAFSDAMEPSLSAALAEGVFKSAPITKDERAQAYLNNLARRLGRASARPNLKYKTFIVESDEINAFTVGGGYLFINKGLIARSRNESELAGVIAHEIGHNVGRHITKALMTTLGLAVVMELARGDNPDQTREIAALALGIGGGLLSLKLSRDHERYADSLAVVEMAGAGIDPRGLPSFFGVIRKQYGNTPAGIEQYLADHPPLEERIRSTERILTRALPRERRTKLQRDSDSFQELRRRMCHLQRFVGADTLAIPPTELTAMKLPVFIKSADSIFVCLETEIEGGYNDDIRLVVTDSLGVRRLLKRRSPRRQDFQLLIRSGRTCVALRNNSTYYLVFDNTISVFADKRVIFRAYLRYRAI